LVFTSRRHTALLRSYGLKQEFITPHCPQKNRMVERVIRTLKEQCIHCQRFDSLQHAGRIIGDRIQYYNDRRSDQAPDMKSPAEALGLGPRTVQRRLDENGLNFRTLVTVCRMRRARDLLSETNASVDHVSRELGYSCVSHFSRAISKDHGSAPSEFRQSGHRNR
jgi:AraC-like DNA-binding protein